MRQSHCNADLVNRAKINRLCLLCLFLFLLCGVKLFFHPIEINEFENRYAEKLPYWTMSGWFSGSYQDQMERALADQLPFAIRSKQIYNKGFSSVNAFILDRMMECAANTMQRPLAEPDNHGGDDAETIQTIQDPTVFYWTLPDSNRQVLAGHLMYTTRFLDHEREKLDSRIENINQTIENHPEITFYLYYIEKETDVDFITGECSGIYEYIRSHVDSIPDNQIERFRVSSFEQFDDQFYKTDHHWNDRGSYAAYVQILRWLLPDEQPLVPLAEYDLGTMVGSKATGSSAAGYSDVFQGYEFTFPSVEIVENGKNVPDYGSQEEVIAQYKLTKTPLREIRYGIYYGGDSGELIFRNAASENGSILILGESYDNALLKLLASHYSTVYSVDLRNYEAQLGTPFSFQDYLTEHSDIDRVLLIGNVDYYVLDTFDIPQ